MTSTGTSCYMYCRVQHGVTVELSLSFILQSFPAINLGKHEAQRRVLGIEFDGLLKRRLGFFELIEMQIGLPELRVGLRVLRRDLYSLSKVLQRVLWTAVIDQ